MDRTKNKNSKNTIKLVKIQTSEHGKRNLLDKSTYNLYFLSYIHMILSEWE